MKSFVVYWVIDDEEGGTFDLDAPNLETAYEMANAEWPDLIITSIVEA